MKTYNTDGLLVSSRDDATEPPERVERRLAKNIKVVSRGSRDYSLLIDGQEFPFHISDEGIRLNVIGTRMPSVTVTILAESVESLHDVNAAPETNAQRKARLVADMEKRKRPA